MIQVARRRKGLSRAEVAEKLGLENNYYGTCESGRNPIPENRLSAIANCLDIDENELRTAYFEDKQMQDEKRQVSQFSLLLKKARKEKNLTMDALAQVSGVSKQSIFNLENKAILPKEETLEKLIKALELDRIAVRKALEDVQKMRAPIKAERKQITDQIKFDLKGELFFQSATLFFRANNSKTPPFALDACAKELGVSIGKLKQWMDGRMLLSEDVIMRAGSMVGVDEATLLAAYADDKVKQINKNLTLSLARNSDFFFQSGKLVFEARKSNVPQITLLQIAKGVSVSRALISAWETGVTLPSREIALRVARMLKIPEKSMTDALIADSSHRSVDKILNDYETGAIILRKRVNLNISPLNLAKKCGLPLYVIYRWEKKGFVGLKDEKFLQKISEVLKLELEEFTNAYRRDRAKFLERKANQAVTSGQSNVHKDGCKSSRLVETRRKEKFWSRAKLATKARVRAVVIASWERGESLPVTSKVESVARALEIPEAELLALVEQDRNTRNIMNVKRKEEKHDPQSSNRTMSNPIGDLISKQRMKKGISQIDMAERAAVSASLISSLESGKRLPSLNTCLKIAKVLEIDAEQLKQLYITVRPLSNVAQISPISSKQDMRVTASCVSMSIILSGENIAPLQEFLQIVQRVISQGYNTEQIIRLNQRLRKLLE